MRDEQKCQKNNRKNRKKVEQVQLFCTLGVKWMLAWFSRQTMSLHYNLISLLRKSHNVNRPLTNQDLTPMLVPICN